MSEMLLKHFDLLANAPGGVTRLRELILTLAVQGKLVPQDPADEPASVLLQKIRAEKDRLIAEGKIKRDKPLASITDEEKPFELPNSWEWVRLGEVVEVLDSLRKPVTKEDRRPGPYPYYGASGIVDHVSSYLFDEPLVLVGEDGAKWGAGDKTAFPISGKAWVNNHAHVLRPWRLAVLDIYLVNFLTARDLSEFVTGMTVPKLNQARLMSIPIALPPVAEQSRIVARVEELMCLCDALEAKGKLDAAQHTQLVQTLLGTLTDSASPAELAANWQRVAEYFDLLLDRPEAVDALEQTILQLAVRGLLVPQDPADEPASVLLQKIRAEKDRLIAEGKIKRDKPLAPITDEEKPFELPQGWELVPVEALANVGTGTTPSRDNAAYFSNTGIPWVTSGETGQSLITKTDQFVTARALSETSLALYPVGTLIVAMYGQGKTRGQVAELLIEAATNQACAAIVLIERSESHRQFVKLVFEKSYDEIRNLAAGGAQPNLNVGKVKQTLVPLPPLAEQSRIVARVEALRRLCADLRQRLTASRTTQGHLAEALVECV